MTGPRPGAAAVAPRQALSVPELLHALDGTWSNALGSTLHLSVHPDGSLSGSFSSGAGDCAGGHHAVVGRVDMAPWGRTAVIGFVVAWPASHSMTCWSGRFDAQRRTISATWVMTAEAEEHDAWMATRVGHDEFAPFDAA